MSHYKILYLSRFHPEAVQIKAQLEDSLGYHVIWTKTPQEAIIALKNQSFDLVIFNLELFSIKKLDLVKQIRDAKLSTPVMFLAELIYNANHKFVHSSLRTCVVEKPITAVSLQAIIDRFINEGVVINRIHRRFSTKQKANLIKITNQESTPLQGELKNLSLGGAYISTNTDNYRKGDRIKIEVNLDDLSKRHIMHAQICWISSGGIGIQFIQ